MTGKCTLTAATVLFSEGLEIMGQVYPFSRGGGFTVDELRQCVSLLNIQSGMTGMYAGQADTSQTNSGKFHT